MTAEISEDAVLDGRLVLRQLRRGHRFGHDAILLAAAVSARGGDHAVDLGAGVGAAGLALARRIEGLAVTLIEIDPELCALATENAARNDLAARVRAVCLDVAAPAAAFAATGLGPGTAAHVLMNPPFNPGRKGVPSPDRHRRLARSAADETLRLWVGVSARLLRGQGTLTMIWRADALDIVLAALAAENFGGISLLPVYAKPGAPAIRVLAHAVKASRTPLSLLSGLLLADEAGKPTTEAEAVLRGGAALPPAGN